MTGIVLNNVVAHTVPDVVNYKKERTAQNNLAKSRIAAVQPAGGTISTSSLPKVPLPVGIFAPPL